MRPLELVALATLIASGIGCLPGDERPPPGSLQLNVVQSDATAEGFTTDDGWEVRFDRFVTALGDVELQSDDQGAGENSCTDYAEARYDRLYDFTVAEGGKVGLAHGLGICSVEFRIKAPSTDSILSGGVTARDRETMRIEANDAFATEQRATLLVRGSATREEVRKEFFWTFRRSYEIERCKDASGDGYVSIVELAGGDALERTIEVRGEELFRAAPADDAPLSFDRFAAADADGDGAILMEELEAVAIDLDAILDDVLDELPAELLERFDPSVLGEPNLAMQLYMIQLPRIARMVGSGECENEPRGRFPF